MLGLHRQVQKSPTHGGFFFGEGWGEEIFKQFFSPPHTTSASVVDAKPTKSDSFFVPVAENSLTGSSPKTRTPPEASQPAKCILVKGLALSPSSMSTHHFRRNFQLDSRVPQLNKTARGIGVQGFFGFFPEWRESFSSISGSPAWAFGWLLVVLLPKDLQR